MRSLLAIVLMVASSVLAVDAQENELISNAVAALERGDLVTAESTVKSELRIRPNDAVALGLLGVVLDQQKKYAEADGVYRRAVALSPRSPALLNNYGNHLVAMGRVSEAREIYLQVLALNPGHANAALQLARIALQRKAPREALKYLEALPPTAVASDPQLNLAMGIALAGAGKYDQAERFLSRAVDTAPNDFEALYDLGLAASHAGHSERAREVLEKALALQPENVDAMYDLAAVDVQLNQREKALQLLARAERLAPQRADVLFLLAHTSADLGYFGDAAKAWEHYMSLKPGDDAARREHAFAETAIGDDTQGGLSDLKWYVERHPNDAVGHYELGVAETPSDKPRAIEELNRALTLKPDLVEARVARGFLEYRDGKLQAALVDLQFAAKREPSSPAVLDRLGEIYLALERTNDALPVLRKAAELAPRDSTVLFHYARALSKAGQKEEATAVFARCRELGPAKSAQPHPAGLVDFLSLSPEEQRARYRAGVERTVENNPANVEAQVRYLELLLEDGKTGEAAGLAQKIATLNPSPQLIQDTARALIASEQYPAAKDFIQRMGDAASGELRLDLAIADSHLVSANAAIEEMNGIPAAQRDGDYYLALSTMLEMAQRAADATAALKQAMQQHPTRPDLYRELAALLIKNHRTQEASELLDQAARILPDDAEIAMMKNALKTSALN